jgi:rubredoxin
VDILNAAINFLKTFWRAYEAFVSPFYPFLQWGIGIGAVLLVLGWGANKLGPTFHYCPQCGRVIPKKWNPCRMCGFVFEPQAPEGQGSAEPGAPSGASGQS